MARSDKGLKAQIGAKHVRRGVIATLAIVAIFGPSVIYPWLSARASTQPKIDGTSIETALYRLDVKTLDAPRDPGRGGAIAAFGDDVFLITRPGVFYRLDHDEEAFRPIGLHGPNRIETTAFYSRPVDTEAIGYQDLKLRAAADGLLEATISQVRVDLDRSCVDLSIWQTEFEPARAFGETGPAVDWREIWASSPCITDARGSLPVQGGGDMAFLPDGRLAVFVGDFGVDGYNRKTEGVDPQTLDNDYGKVIAIDLATGAHEILSRGHRNPGGLVVDTEGQLWQSENGSQGGDEINLIIPGRNYGWPLETYGTQYGLRYWPMDDTVGTHDAFTRPIYSFVPSVATSSLVLIDHEDYGAWRGDLLLGEFKTRRITRLHIRDGRVIFAEPIPVSVRVRDLTVGDNGVIYLKDDYAGQVVQLTRAYDGMPQDGTLEAALISAGCATCHNPSRRVAPDLGGLMGARIGARPRFDSSPALAQNGGVWTTEALTVFLRDPQAFAPGSMMPAPDVTEDEIDTLVALFDAAGDD